MTRFAITSTALMLAWLTPQAAFAGLCYDEAGLAYGIDPALLRSIAIIESAEAPKAVNRNSDKSHDLCAMQINTFHMKSLKAYGITEKHLMKQPCLCIKTGAWILAAEIARSGRIWEAVGAYHAGPAGDRKRKDAYITKVQAIYERLSRSEP